MTPTSQSFFVFGSSQQDFLSSLNIFRQKDGWTFWIKLYQEIMPQMNHIKLVQIIKIMNSSGYIVIFLNPFVNRGIYLISKYLESKCSSE